MKRRIGSWLLTLAMVLTLLPAGILPARAEDAGTETEIATGGSNYMEGTNTSRNIAAGPDGTVYVVYNSGEEILLRKRPAGASEFTEARRVVVGSEPEIAVSGMGRIFVAYHNATNGMGASLYIRYSDDGVTFNVSDLTLKGADVTNQSMHLATDGNYVYAVSVGGHYLYRSEDGGATFEAVKLNDPVNPAPRGNVTYTQFDHHYADVLADSKTHKVVVVQDDMRVFYWISSDYGKTFAVPVDAEMILPWCTATCGNGVVYASGAALSAPNNADEVLVIDLVGGGHSKQQINCDASGSGRSIAADDKGNLILGGSTGNGINILISSNGAAGLANGQAEQIAGASAANVAVNPVTGELMFLYEKDGKLVLKEYGGVLQGYNKVYYDANGGTGTMEPQQFESGDAVTLRKNTFTRAGYVFTGWNTASDGSGTAYADEQTITPDAALTLYAQWRRALTVSYDANGGTGTMAAKEFEPGDTVTAAANGFTRRGYTFTGWNTASDGSGTAYAAGAQFTPNASVTLYAQWEPLTYELVYNGNGTGAVNVPGKQEKVHDTPLKLTINTPERTGYRFIGWATDANAIEPSYQPGDMFNDDAAVIDGTITLYAMWAVENVLVSFNANGGEGEMLPQRFAGGYAEALHPCAYTFEGYLFKGWNTAANGSGIDYTDKQSITPTKSMTLYAIWSPCVTFHANDGTDSKVVQRLLLHSETELTPNRFTRKGYDFKNWNTKADGSGTAYADRASILHATEMDLYAIWTPHTYTVHFNANGGTGTMEDQSFTYGTAQSLRANAFTRSGRTFHGWTRSTGGEIEFTNSQSVQDLTDEDGATVVLYAVWEARVNNATVTIQRGNDVYGSVSPTGGDPYRFTVLPGAYNVVIRSGNKTVTRLAEAVEGEQVTGSSAVAPEEASSVLEIKGANTPDIVVGGLDVAAADNRVQGADVELRLTAEGVSADAGSEEQNAIRKLAPQDKSLDFLDLTLTKTVNDTKDETFQGTTADDLTIIIPFKKAATKDIVVYRCHDGVVDTLTVNPHQGEYIVVGDDMVTICAKKFSIYAICYTPLDPGITYATCPRNQECPITPFDDANPMSWYHDGVHWAIDIGAMKGVSSRRFLPEGTTDRAQIVTILWRLQGSPRSNYLLPFLDVPDDAWYTPAIRWAAANGIVEGVSGHYFDPNGILTREQLATILYRYIRYRGASMLNLPALSLGEFKDAGQVSSWARDAMAWLATYGILDGTTNAAGERFLLPQGSATRAQTATVMMRYWREFVE